MKKIMLLLCVLLAGLTARAADPVVTIGDVKIMPGETVALSLNLTNDSPMKGFQLDIALPEGLSFVGTTANDVKAAGRLAALTGEDAFTIRKSIKASGALGIIAAYNGPTVQAGDGPIMTINVTCADATALAKLTGTIKGAKVKLESGNYTLTNTEFNVKVYKMFTVTATSADATMGSVTGGGEYESGSEVTLTATPAEEGYSFVKWSDDVTDNPRVLTVNADATLTATFKANSYKSTFVLGNGEENIVKTQDYKTALAAPAAPTWTGYTFKGWTPEVPSTVPVGDKTYTAQWQINQYTMTFVLGNGEENIVKTQNYQTALEKPADPTREGYTFKGWDKEIPATIPAEDMTFTAQWQINQYKMTFKLENGEADVEKTQDYGTELTAPANLTKTGYTFKGWTPEVPATVPASDKTFTAQWEINQYTMTFVLGNGEENIVKTQNYQSALEKPADPTREGYTFKGWDAEIPATIPAENKTFTAQWEINQYTMTFKLENGESDVEKTQDYGSELTAPANLTKTGYTFKGWSPEVPATVPASDKTYTAQWEINQYTMTFVLGNGEENIVKTQNYQTALEKPADPQREGYTFTGWDAEIPATIPAENKTFTAQWQINQYKMTFKLENGEADVEKTQDYGTELTAPANLTKTGYTFKGWSPEVPATVPASDKTFTAQWEINQYTMTFVLGNGEENIVKTQNYQTALEKPADPTREGYTFTGWDAEIPATIPAEDMTFTAQWQVNKYKVTFIVDGQVVKEGEVEYGAAIEKPADPQKDTYTFIGWTPEVPATMPASDQTFTAQFALNPYTMTFVLGNGEADIVKTQECGSDLTPPADPTREGYTFTGWSPEVPATIPDHDMTFTAQWQINQYKMTFKLENGESDVEKTQDYGTELTAPADPQKTGYTFKGWSPKVPATIPASDMTFTAQWEINQYTMTFVLGNGEADIVKTQDYQSTLEKPADPTREGYTFTGWDTEIPATVPAENKTFTAQWQVNKYKVTFIVDGQVVKEGEVEYGAAIEKPADPQKDTYTFIGWTPEVPATMPATDLTFTAQFAQNPYTMTFVLGNGEADIVKTQECGSDLTPPADPTREGYTFTGWSPEVPATVPGQDMTFTAQWKVNQYAIIYMVNGQEWARDMVDYGTAITLRQYTPNTDETFSGWTFEDGETYTTMPAHDVVVVGTIVTSIQEMLKNQESVDVYDLRGRLMRRNIPVSELRKVLRTGVYIINGRQVVIKK